MQVPGRSPWLDPRSSDVSSQWTDAIRGTSASASGFFPSPSTFWNLMPHAVRARWPCTGKIVPYNTRDTLPVTSSAPGWTLGANRKKRIQKTKQRGRKLFHLLLENSPFMLLPQGRNVGKWKTKVISHKMLLSFVFYCPHCCWFIYATESRCSPWMKK